MRSLLVIPQYKSRDEYYNVPLGMAYINGALRNAGLDVECVNLNEIDERTCQNVYQHLAKIIKDNEISIVLSGGLSPHWKNIKSVFETAKGVDSSIVTNTLSEFRC